MKHRLLTIVAFASGSMCVTAPCLLADYIVTLNNGREIVVEGFREDSGMLIFRRNGGEFGLPKDQIRALSAVEQTERATRSTAKAPASDTKPAPYDPAGPDPTRTTRSTANDSTTGQVKEEDYYQEQVKAISLELRELRQRYSLATRGTKGSDPEFFTTPEAFRGHQEDLLSRLRDAQKKQVSTADAFRSTTSSFKSSTQYSEKQKELSEIRNQMRTLEMNRERLIAEMKEKKFDTGSLVLE